MIAFEQAIELIRRNGSFTSNDYDDSYYRTYNTPKGVIQVRVSNHGTHLWTWVSNAPVNPSECYANICIVLSEDGKHNSSTTVKANKFKGEPGDNARPSMKKSYGADAVSESKSNESKRYHFSKA